MDEVVVKVKVEGGPLASRAMVNLVLVDVATALSFNFRNRKELLFKMECQTEIVEEGSKDSMAILVGVCGPQGCGKTRFFDRLRSAVIEIIREYYTDKTPIIYSFLESNVKGQWDDPVYLSSTGEELVRHLICPSCSDAQESPETDDTIKRACPKCSAERRARYLWTKKTKKIRRTKK